MDSENLLPFTGIIAVAVVYTAAAIALAVVGYKAFAKTETGAAKSFGRLFQRSVRFLTVATVVLAALVLAAMGKFTEGMAAFLSGIAGYVLGGLTKDDNGTG